MGIILHSLPRRVCGDQGGYSLIELLVMVGVLALLMGIFMPALSKARTTAQMQMNQNNIRQLNIAYNGYSADFQNGLLPGYPYSGTHLLGGVGVVEGTRVTPSSASSPWNCMWGGQMVTVTAQTAARYPVRLSAYAGDMNSLVQGHRSETFSAANSGDSAKAVDLASTHPTWGLNSLYVGGHGVSGNGAFVDAASSGGGFSNATGKVIAGGNAVLRLEDVRRPSGLITFLDSKRRDEAMNIQGTGPGVGTMPGHDGVHREGSFVCYPPKFANVNSGGFLAASFRLWKEGIGETHESAQPDADMDLRGAMPSPWWGAGVVTSYMDGHANTMTIEQLNDMRLWSNHAEGKDDAVGEDGDPTI